MNHIDHIDPSYRFLSLPRTWCDSQRLSVCFISEITKKKIDGILIKFQEMLKMGQGEYNYILVMSWIPEGLWLLIYLNGFDYQASNLLCYVPLCYYCLYIFTVVSGSRIFFKVVFINAWRQSALFKGFYFSWSRALTSVWGPYCIEDCLKLFLVWEPQKRVSGPPTPAKLLGTVCVFVTLLEISRFLRKSKWISFRIKTKCFFSLKMQLSYK